MKYERFRAACAAMQSLITSDRWAAPSLTAREAVRFADALMKELDSGKGTAGKEAANKSGASSTDRGASKGEGLPRAASGVAVECKRPEA